MSPIANMLVQIKNAQAVGHTEVMLPFSKMKYAIATILKDEGFLASVEQKQKKAKKAEIPYLALALKYVDDHGAINGIRLISKPSRRMYAGKDELPKVKSGYGISVVSTSKGIMTGAQARKEGIGGELIFEIW